MTGTKRATGFGVNWPKQATGFGAMTPERRREIAVRGGTVAAERSRAGVSSPHRFNSDTARAAALKRYGK